MSSDHGDGNSNRSSSSGGSTVQRVSAPILQGVALAAGALALENVPGAAYSAGSDGGLFSLRKVPGIHGLAVTSKAGPLPGWKRSLVEEKAGLTIKDLFMAQKVDPNLGNESLLSFRHFHEAFLSKRVTPIEVIGNLLKRIKQTHKSSDGTSPAHFHFVHQLNDESVLTQAKESAKRYEEGKSLSPLDGVPVIVKDEVDVRGYETRCGTSFVNKGNPATDDATPVQKLREAGAIIIGKAAMDEWGWAVFGVNPNTGTPRNPHNMAHSCGGSSSGCGGAVAAGFCPIALGCDGGGSIRIPSSFCGIFGLKPTAGRISAYGAYPLDTTVGVSGPMAATADDLAVGYLAMAGADLKDEATLEQPPPHVPKSFLRPSMKGVRVGIMSKYSAQVEEKAITEAFELVKRKLVEDGAELVEVDIPYLENIRMAHAITISSEMNTVLSSLPERSKTIWANRIMQVVTGQITAVDFVIAQKLRTILIQSLTKLFDPNGQYRITYLLTPSTAITSPPLPSPPRVLSYGSSNNVLASDAMRYMFIANFAGIPGVSVPVAGGANGMPVGIQFMTEWWGEGKLLEAAKWVEGNVWKEDGGRWRVPRAGKWIGDFVNGGEGGEEVRGRL
ncbi:hypothetical protein HDU76_007658 [Blyttiomyces sp. JEL0837]|nr:hypothetical protein HDU76_007658 [Blyttiomyces sp. JEL0837]